MILPTPSARGAHLPPQRHAQRDGPAHARADEHQREAREDLRAERTEGLIFKGFDRCLTCSVHIKAKRPQSGALLSAFRTVLLHLQNV